MFPVVSHGDIKKRTTLHGHSQIHATKKNADFQLDLVHFLPLTADDKKIEGRRSQMIIDYYKLDF